MVRRLDVTDWEEHIFNEFTNLGIAISEEMVVLFTELSLEYFEEIGLVDYKLSFEKYND